MLPTPDDPPPFRLQAGQRPLLISIPHAGTHVPAGLRARLSPAALSLPDTDWHLEQLYGELARALGASLLVATHSRYVIDLNRPPDDASLYPGQNVTGLCPRDTFDEQPLYLDPAEEPDATEIERRRVSLWKPYHDGLAAELARLHAAHGAVALWDAHSIRSVVPRFFDGELPGLNLGTAGGDSCDRALASRLLSIAVAGGFGAVLDGRFKGGYITRHNGRPGQGVHAVQLEMTWRCYMEETPPYRYRPDLAARVQPTLRQLLETTLAHVEALGQARAG